MNGKPKKRLSFEDKHKTIPPEEIEKGRGYTFNFNPEDQPSRDGSGVFKRNTFCEFDERVKKVLSRCGNATIKAVWEISRKGRWHLHGTIKIHNVIEFYINDLQRLMFHGTLEIDTISDISKWETYCYKQKTLMEPYCDIHDMEYEYITGSKKDNEYKGSDLLES